MVVEFNVSSDLDQRIDDLYAEVGRRLRTARKRARLTQAQLADTINMSRSSVANLEAGRQRMPLHLLIWIARVIHVSPADLLPEASMFDDVIVLPDLTDHLASDEDSMRDFVQQTIAKLAVSPRKGT
jgi:transcriptional regulator with XRE-family HTH domain